MKKTILVRLSLLSDEFMQKVFSIMKRKIEERCDSIVLTEGKGDYTVTLAIKPGIGKEGYSIEDLPDGTVCISGNDNRGLLYGVGKFLRTSCYSGGDFCPGSWRGTSVPVKEVRGMYFATHFHNFYHDAPLDEVERYIEDIALWGINILVVWFDMHHYKSIHDTDAKELIGRLHAILKAARDVGIGTGLTVIANEAYTDSPVELRAEWTSGHDGYVKDLDGHYHVELCPNKPGAVDLILKWRKEVLLAFADIKLDYIWIWPYDQGGCTCSSCAPWGSNGFLKIAGPVAYQIKEIFPDAKIVLSTWYFDLFYPNEWEAFGKAFANDPKWVDYILAEHPGRYPEYPLKHGVPGGLPLLGFPEISMFESFPWGAYGANPLPSYVQKMWDEAGKRLAGGFPYSEGIFEDINKFLCSSLYWNGGGDVYDALREYICFEYSEEATDDILSAVRLLEKANKRSKVDANGDEINIYDEKLISEGKIQYIKENCDGIDEAYRILMCVDEKLYYKVRSSWRWRILLLRGVIDYELYHNDFYPSERCDDAFEQLISIYHAENASSLLKPPSVKGRAQIRWN